MPEEPSIEEQSSPFVGPSLRKIFYAYAKAFDEGTLEVIPSRAFRENWPQKLQELKDLETQAAARMIELSYPK